MLDMILADSPINIVEEIKNESISPRLDRKLNRNNNVLSGRTDSVWEILIVYKLQTRNANFRLNLLDQTMLLISRSLELFQDWVWEPLGKMLINKWLLIILIVWSWLKYSIKDTEEGGLLKDHKAKELFQLRAI